MAPVVVTSELTKSFGPEYAVRSVDLVIEEGTILGLIGPSGCGKTSLIRMLAGITEPTSGTATVLGSAPQRFRARERMQIGYMPQLPVLFPNLSVWGNLTFVASLYGLPLRHRRRHLSELLEFVGLAGDRRKLLRDCSGGMQRRLALAATLVHQPRLLFLDEPTAGIDPILRERFWERFRDLRAEGRTLAVSTQYVGEAVSCDLVGVMSGGRLLTVQTPQGLSRTAFGGDVLDVVVEGGWMHPATISALAALPYVLDVRRTDHGASVVVRDAEADGGALRGALAAADVRVEAVTPGARSYEEIFVAIVEADQAQQNSEAA